MFTRIRSIINRYNKASAQGFILPTVITLGVIIMITTVTVVQVISQSSVDMRSQYFTELAKEAAEAGLTQGNHCTEIAVSGSTLYPGQGTGSGSMCSGGGIPGTTLVEQSNWKSTFEVTVTAGELGPTVHSKGTVSVYANDARTGVAVATYTKEINSVLTSSTGTPNVDASQSHAVTKIASGGGHSCALSAGKVYCWGNNVQGQLGTGDWVPHGDPVLVTQSWPTSAKVIDVQVGADSSCALVENDNTPDTNEVYCWGKNNLGQTGNGNSSIGNVLTPARVQGLDGKRIVQLASGTNMTSPSCVLTDETGVNAYCWGGNQYGQIGNNTSGYDDITYNAVFTASRVQDPYGVFSGKHLTAISANNYTVCGAVDSGEVYCWGWSVPAGQSCSMSMNMLGTATSGSCLRWKTPYQAISASYFGNMPVTKLAAGGWSNCAIAGGKAYCWANDAGYALGNGTSVGNTTRPYPVLGIPTSQVVTDIDLDSSTGCAIAGGQLYCWGENGSGQMGLGDNIKDATRNSSGNKVPFFNDKTVTSIGAGYTHMCATASGSVYCWGKDSNKRLIGNSQYSEALTPIKTSNPALDSEYPVSSVSAGSTHTCAIIQDRVFCWGRNDLGQLGNGDLALQTTPQKIKGTIQDMKAGIVSAGTDFTCASATVAASGDDQVYCWGRNDDSQLGRGTATPYETLPALVTGFPASMKVTSLSAGNGFACATVTTTSLLTTGGYCWGRNDDRQLGGSSTTVTPKAAATWIPVTTLPPPVTSISAGRSTACAIANTNQWLYCWGKNEQGMLGRNIAATTTTAGPTRVSGVGAVTATTQFQSVSLSRNTYSSIDPSNGPFACALISGPQDVTCWGSAGSGQLGYAPSPVVPYVGVPQLAGTGDLANQSVVKLSAGSRHACSLSMNTTTVCWGDGSSGQIGNNGTNPSTAPQRINTFGDLRYSGVNRYVTDISAGGQHTCAVADSTIYCWGNNTYGQLGTGDQTDYKTPKQVLGYGTVGGTRVQTGIRF